MAKIDVLLTSLEKVKFKGSDRWIACCPAHKDKSPSLSVRLIDDKILIHCFAGCGVDEIVSSIGLTLADLMPDRINEHGTSHSKIPTIPARDLLEFIHFEALIVTVALSDFLAHKSITQKDLNRVIQAQSRLSNALSECKR